MCPKKIKVHSISFDDNNMVDAAVLELHIASQMGHLYVILEMDTKEIIMNLQTYEQSWSVEGALLDEVRNLFNRFAHISCQFALRECNEDCSSIGRAPVSGLSSVVREWSFMDS
ncbi:hypothetical protein Pyn_31327 [Prunus yedoensis var. nudiflora]|uniref:RNase H type-1 domain-containing protein n=1 Tax=Prunus yedoensis var. nudiflora TaxID=2094558 RepID=A0A314XM01_PRUYE|nr:hypothetical protein Pyn_31327 [Prunus yedoensis var. nudiflora]